MSNTTVADEASVLRRQACEGLASASLSFHRDELPATVRYCTQQGIEASSHGVALGTVLAERWLAAV